MSVDLVRLYELYVFCMSLDLVTSCGLFQLCSSADLLSLLRTNLLPHSDRLAFLSKNLRRSLVSGHVHVLRQWPGSCVRQP
jgi:hypothetical protein